MSLAPPQILARKVQADGFNVLESEVMAEKASSLGHHGRLVEKALAALKAHDGVNAEARLALLRTAAHEVWAFFVQRELCGLRDQKEVIRLYEVSPEVLARLGAMEKR
jgi:hypothetical protein